MRYADKCKHTDRKHAGLGLCQNCYTEYKKKNRNPIKKFMYNKNRFLSGRYGININIYNSMFNSQGGRCKICNTHQLELAKSLSVDHDHKTKKVRGLLCDGCNTKVGNVESGLFDKIVNYIEEYKVK